MLFIPIQRGEGIGTPTSTHGRQRDGSAEGAGVQPAGSPCLDATGGGEETGWEGAVHHFLPLSGMGSGEGSVSRGGREVWHWGGPAVWGTLCLPTEVPEPHLSMAARVSGHAGAAGSSSAALRRRHALVLSWHLWHPCRERKMLRCQSLFLVVPTPLWQEQSQTTIPHLHLLPVELQPPSQLRVPARLVPGACPPSPSCQQHRCHARWPHHAELLCQLGKTL